MAATDYATPIRLDVRLGGQDIAVFTKPGLADWQSISPAASLLAEHTVFAPGDKALLIGSGHGAAAVCLAKRLDPGELWILDHSALALELTKATLEANHIHIAHTLWKINLQEGENGSFDAVALELPKGRKLAQRWLAQTWVALRPGGHLYLSGANALGVQTVLKDAESLFGPSTILDYKKGNRVARLTRPASSPDRPAWLDAPGILPGSWHELKLDTPLGNFRLASLPGVFSYDRLDEATHLLVGVMQVRLGERVADLGCGYGILGLVAAKMGAAWVDLLDVNMLAIAAAQENIGRLGLDNAQAIPSDVLSSSKGLTYDRIITNPPFHAGKGVDYRIAAAFIEQSHAALTPGGELQLVANRFIRYEKLMEGRFQKVTVVAEDEHYRVLAAVKT